MTHDHDTTGIHGMLLFGEGALYLSHLPMFHHPHNFHVLLEIDLGAAARGVLDADRKDPAPLYTFLPDAFPIAGLDPAGGGPARDTLRGTLFRGHFERRGTRLAEDVEVRITNTPRFHEFPMSGSHAFDRTLTYQGFGHPGELYLAHDITARPDFDQVVRVRPVPGSVRNQAGMAVGDDVTLFDFPQAQQVRVIERTDVPGQRLLPGDSVEALLPMTAAPFSGAHGFLMALEVREELYLEIGELT
ncbi:hypothetical protein OIE66_23380 [Nonomuraea sp. NBC_01738]|uniref:hypothetical protein n=1 Tax=Nonomuraea sp. NBC_01738 TaxID=2976003 RepID=UPI002E1614F0|nr:hypothetical protein OIE66_23380 [Nonomuraea sp. NBC_01738]